MIQQWSKDLNRKKAREDTDKCPSNKAVEMKRPTTTKCAKICSEAFISRVKRMRKQTSKTTNYNGTRHEFIEKKVVVFACEFLVFVWRFLGLDHIASPAHQS